MKKFEDYQENEKHIILKNILDKAQLTNSINVSHKWGSHYWSIENDNYRVSDHTKQIGSFGYELYKDGADRDFRNYNDFYNFLKTKYDIYDKTEQEIKYKEEARKYIKKVMLGKEEVFKQPDGSMFSSMESALNNMWRLKKGLTSEKLNFGGNIKDNHSSLGISKQLGIPTNVMGHDMIAKCVDCGDKFSYQKSKSNILWECPNCLSKKHIS